MLRVEAVALTEKEIIGKVQTFTANYKSKTVSDSTDQNPRQRRYKGVLIKPLGKVWYTRLEEYDIPAEIITRLNSCGVYYVADLYKSEFETEPGWKMVRELFASILASVTAG